MQLLISGAGLLTQTYPERRAPQKLSCCQFQLIWTPHCSLVIQRTTAINVRGHKPEFSCIQRSWQLNGQTRPNTCFKYVLLAFWLW